MSPVDVLFLRSSPLLTIAESEQRPVAYTWFNSLVAKKKRVVRRRKKTAAASVGLSPDETLVVTDTAAARLAAQVKHDGGAVLAQYREPFGVQYPSP